MKDLNQVFIHFLTDPNKRKQRHLFLWAVVIFVICPAMAHKSWVHFHLFATNEGFMLQDLYKDMLFDSLINVGMIAVNIYLLIPYFLTRGKYISYFVSSILIITMIYWFWATYPCTTCERYFQMVKEGGWWFRVSDFVSEMYWCGSFFFGVSAIKLLKQWYLDQEKIRNLQMDSLTHELNALKYQVNPHFLFNTLNNIYIMNKLDSKKASEIILQLSDLLRYQLYDCAEEKVKLSDEVNYLKNLLDLERIRKESADIRLDTQGNINGQLIPPFLFLPFIENAIKHGLNRRGESYIHTLIHLDNNELNFQVENLNPPVDTTKNSGQGGIGLANIKRRLDLLFPQRYDLKISELDNKFTVKLKLKL